MIASLLERLATEPPPLLATGLLAAALAGLFFVALRARAPRWSLFAIGMAPTVVAYVSSPCLRVYSGHGFLHASILYQVRNGFLPPMNPLLWGEPLMYPWVHELPVAALVALRMPPTYAFALVNAIALAGTLILVWKTATIGTANRAAAGFAVLLSVFGLTILDPGPIAALVERVAGAAIVDSRVHVAAKFLTHGGMPLGVMFYALFLFALVRLFVGGASSHRVYVLLSVALLGAGYVYPLIWLAMLANHLGAVVLMLVLQRARAVRVALLGLACSAVVTLALLPYFHQLSAGRDDGAAASFLLLPEVAVAATKLIKVVLFVAPLGAVALWKSAGLRAFWRGREVTAGILGSAIVADLAMYVLLVVTPPLVNEYKYLLLACLPLGLLAAGALEAAYREHRVACFAIVAAFLLGMSEEWIRQSAWQACDNEVVERASLGHRDPGSEALYAWVRSSTPRDAAFLDTALDVPVFGQRALFVGGGGWFQPGWTTAPMDFLASLRHPFELVQERVRLAEALYGGTGAPSDELLAELRRITGDSAVFVVVRDPASRGRFAQSPGLEGVFDNEVAAVYRVREGGR